MTIVVLIGSLLLILYVTALMYWQRKFPELRWDWDEIEVNDIKFPSNFLWGVATAAHQVEGNCDNNNWSAWENAVDAAGQPRIKRGQKAGLACDHWNRYREDIKLMQALSVKAYRFSVEWSKIEPNEGEVNAAAMRHYREVCEELQSAGIQPMITLHHFTQPLWFDRSGAFEQENNIPLFVRFCENVFQALHDLVPIWCTINEPEVYAAQGYFTGIFPPGKKDANAAGLVLKNLLEAHVQAYHALKRLPGGAQAQIGFAKNVFQFDPYRYWHPGDWILSRRLNLLFNDSIFDFFNAGHFKFHTPGLVKVEHHNSAAVRALDFIGLNYYSHFHVKLKWDRTTPFTFACPPNQILTDMPFAVYPEGFYRAVKEISRLNAPIYVTENGIADAKDDRRELFIRRYLYALSQALKAGEDVRGYFYWSLLDNFEWAEGYDMKFGLYEVDFATQKRKLREGARGFVEIVKRDAAS